MIDGDRAADRQPPLGLGKNDGSLAALWVEFPLLLFSPPGSKLLSRRLTIVKKRKREPIKCRGIEPPVDPLPGCLQFARRRFDRRRNRRRASKAKQPQSHVFLQQHHVCSLRLPPSAFRLPPSAFRLPPSALPTSPVLSSGTDSTRRTPLPKKPSVRPAASRACSASQTPGTRAVFCGPARSARQYRSSAPRR